MKKSSLHLVVIGTSAGGYAALEKMVGQLDPVANACYCIVVHLSNIEVPSTLTKRLQPLTDLPCVAAESGLILKKGKIYIAQPGRHLLIKDGKLLIGYGPEENNFRPSINVLFRSAAIAYRSRTIGIILTGLMTDGVSGMEAIKLCGGVLMVQNPKEAEFPDLPNAILKNIKVDHKVSLIQMGSIITSVVTRRINKEGSIPRHILAEAKRSEKMSVSIEGMNEVGEQSPYSCPDCGGVLWEKKKDKNDFSSSYRCHIGHVYTEAELLNKQAKEAESAIWLAIRLMEERKHLLLKIADDFKKRKIPTMVQFYNQRATDIKDQIDKMKNLLVTIEDNNFSPSDENNSLK
jgi:two-component system chemotaxis response regulator CheB